MNMYTACSNYRVVSSCAPSSSRALCVICVSSIRSAQSNMLTSNRPCAPRPLAWSLVSLDHSEYGFLLCASCSPPQMERLNCRSGTTWRNLCRSLLLLSSCCWSCVHIAISDESSNCFSWLAARACSCFTRYASTASVAALKLIVRGERSLVCSALLALCLCGCLVVFRSSVARRRRPLSLCVVGQCWAFPTLPVKAARP